jgi:hypothetical protein
MNDHNSRFNEVQASFKADGWLQQTLLNPVYGMQ